jgi:hypothetical protein
MDVVLSYSEFTSFEVQETAASRFSKEFHFNWFKALLILFTNRRYQVSKWETSDRHEQRRAPQTQGHND